MAESVRVYFKRTLRLDHLSTNQRDMVALGTEGLNSIRRRLHANRDSSDQPAPPLKSESWKRIKKKQGLRPIRDLWGTGMAWPAKSKSAKPRKPVLKFVGHLLDLIHIQSVTDHSVLITEPTTRFGRIKARRHAYMMQFSPNNRSEIAEKIRSMLSQRVKRLAIVK